MGAPTPATLVTTKCQSLIVDLCHKVSHSLPTPNPHTLQIYEQGGIAHISPIYSRAPGVWVGGKTQEHGGSARTRDQASSLYLPSVPAGTLSLKRERALGSGDKVVAKGSPQSPASCIYAPPGWESEPPGLACALNKRVQNGSRGEQGDIEGS